VSLNVSNVAGRAIAPGVARILVVVWSLYAGGAAAQSSGAASFRGGASHAGSYAGGGTTILGLQWRFLTNGDVISSPTVVGNSVFVGSGDGNMYALDRLTGAKLWSFAAGSAVSSSPAVEGGTVYFGTYDGRFFAVDARTGSLRWRLSTGAVVPFPWGHESGDRYTSSPSVANGLVVFGAGDGHVYAVDATTGKTRWRAATGGRVRGSPALGNGTAFIGSFDGRVYAFDLGTGKLRWRYDTEGATLQSEKYGFDRRSIQSSPALVNGVVFIGARDGFVYALDANSGALKWKYDHKISWINSSPAVAGGVLYDGSSDAQFVQALDASTGRELWRTNVGSIVWSSPAVAGDQLFVGDGAGRLHIFDRRSGKLLASFRTGSQIFSSPAVVGDLVFVGSTDGSVYALRLSRDPPVQRVVFLDSAYVRAGAAGHSVETAAYLAHRGYSIVNPAALAEFLHARIADRQPSVVVFATDHLPPALTGHDLRTSPLRRYLDAGGKVVWSGVPPMLWSIDSAGKFPALLDFTWNAPSELLDVPHHSAIFDPRGVTTNDVGLRWGLPRRWRAAYGIQPSGATLVLGTDEWGLAAAWVKSYGGVDGTGFVRTSDDDLAIYLSAEYRPRR
jgi:eukaryotic-like serine/threonine-protein kinase